MDALTKAEREVVEYVCLQCMSSTAIAALTNRSARTVEEHRERACHKVGAANIQALCKWYWTQGKVA